MKNKTPENIYQHTNHIKEKQTLHILKKILRYTKGTKIVVYKGIDLSLHYYPAGGQRPYTDIDLCVLAKNYTRTKTQISKIPGVFLLSQETRFGKTFFGHALYFVPKNGLYIELHISKNPINLWEYLSGKEYKELFFLSRRIPLGRYYYYSLARTEYAYLIVRQFLKELSLHTENLSLKDFTPYLQDFTLILKKYTPQDWKKTNAFLKSKSIFMRLYRFHTPKTWALFLKLSELQGVPIPDEIRKKLHTQLGVIQVEKINHAVMLLCQGKVIPLKKILVTTSLFLFLCRMLVLCIHPFFFRARKKIRL